MLRHRIGLIGVLLGLQSVGWEARASDARNQPGSQDPPAWWFCRAIGKRIITGDAVLLYADSATSFARAIHRGEPASYVFNATGATSREVRDQFMAAARLQYPEVVNWRAACDGYTSREQATQADKASRSRDRAAFPPAEWFPLGGFRYRRQ